VQKGEAKMAAIEIDPVLEELVADDDESTGKVWRYFLTSPQGRSFAADYDSDANRKLLARKVLNTGRPLTKGALCVMFDSLVNIGAMRKVVPVAEKPAIEYRNPITGQIIPEDWFVIATRATKAEIADLKSRDAGFKNYCQDLIRHEMRENVNHPNSGVPQPSAEKRPWISDAAYADLQRWCDTYHRMPTADIKKKMNPALTPKDECERFTANFEMACRVGLI
jgi:hypothetical protein